MSGLAAGYAATALDTLFVDTDYIMWSENGTSETAKIARTSIKPGATGWAAASSGSPASKSNGAALTTAAASSGGTFTHFAVVSASSGGTQKTDWTALNTSRTLATGETLTAAVGALAATLE